MIAEQTIVNFRKFKAETGEPISAALLTVCVALAGTITNVPELLTVKQAAERRRVSPDSIYRATQDGRLPRLKIGRTIRIRASDLDAMDLSAA